MHPRNTSTSSSSFDEALRLLTRDQFLERGDI